MKDFRYSFIVFSLIIIGTAPQALQAKPNKAKRFFKKASNWISDQAHVAKSKVKSIVHAEINTVEDLSKNVAKVIGGGAMIVYGYYLAHANLIRSNQQPTMQQTGIGFLGVAVLLAGIPIFADGAKELSQKKINFEAIADDAQRYVRK